MSDYYQLLVFGLVRRIEKLLNDGQLIPDSIYDVCFMYYYVMNRIFYFKGMDINLNGVAMADLHNDKHWTFQIYDSKDGKLFDGPENSSWILNFTPLSCKNGIILPPSIHKTFSNFQFFNHSMHSKKSNIIFKYDRQQREFDGYVFDENALFKTNTNDTIMGVRWSLPRITNLYNTNIIWYSDYDNCVYSNSFTALHKLSFDPNDAMYMNQNLVQWKWTQIASGLKHRIYPSCTNIMKQDKQYVFIAGGFFNGRWFEECEMYDIKENKSIEIDSCSVGRRQSGIYYDEYGCNVYICGGNNNMQLKKTEYYNVEQNKWYSLPETNFKHPGYPLVWMENNNILHVASIPSNAMEKLDLRCDTKWINIYEPDDTPFDSVFGDAVSFKDCRYFLFR